MTASALPRVTIAMPCFNAADTIERALASAQGQAWDNLEILVCDDASTDSSPALVEAAAAEDSRIRFIRQPTNLGAGATRARLVEEASGEFLCFFDDDDESFPERVAVQVQRILAYEASTGAELVACYASGTTRFSEALEVEAPAIGSRSEPLIGPAVAEYLLINWRRPDWFYGTGVPTCALAIRRTAVLRVDSFDSGQRRLQDVDLAIRLALSGGHFIGTSERLYIRHVTESADKAHEVILNSWLRLADKYRPFLETRGQYEYARRWPKLRYWRLRHRYFRFALELAGLLLRHPIAVPRHLLLSAPARHRLEETIRRSRLS